MRPASQVRVAGSIIIVLYILQPQVIAQARQYAAFVEGSHQSAYGNKLTLQTMTSRRPNRNAKLPAAVDFACKSECTSSVYQDSSMQSKVYQVYGNTQ